MDGSTWFRVVATVAGNGSPGTGAAVPTAVAADLVADALWQAGSPAVEERDDPDGPTLLAGFPTEAGAEAAAAAARAAGAARVHVEPIADDGLDGWRAHARPQRAGSFTIAPPWIDASPTPGDRLLVVDPGRSFGSGSHPTSRLVLAALERLVTPSTTVLDVGCGSGILAVGAALLGAPSVHGIDVDEGAPAATLANAARNGVAERVTASGEPLAAVASSGRRYDVVAANLLAPILVDLAADLRAVVAPGGTIVVSGLLADRWEPTVDTITAGSDLVAEAPVRDEDWVAVALGRPGP